MPTVASWFLPVSERLRFTLSYFLYVEAPCLEQGVNPLTVSTPTDDPCPELPAPREVLSVINPAVHCREGMFTFPSGP